MTTELQDIIRKSTFDIQVGKYVYAKVARFPEQNHHFFVSKDSDEITVVTKEEYIADLSMLERNKDDYALIALNVSIPFYCVGFLAVVSSAIADKGMDILIVSTYSKDYILVRHDKLDDAKSTLLDLGFSAK